MKTYWEIKETIDAARSVVEEHEYGFGYSRKSSDHASNGMSSLKKSNLKVNHSANSEHDSGNTPGSAQHKNPDVTDHYERGAKPHRDSPSGVTLHTSAAKAHDSAKHFKKSDDHSEDEDED